MIFGAPKEYVLSEPLKDNLKIGFAKTEPQNPKEDNKIKIIIIKLILFSELKIVK